MNTIEPKWNYPPLSLLDDVSAFSSKSQFVTFKQILTSQKMQNLTNKLMVTLGMTKKKTIEVENLENLNHVLIGGSTGAGKSMLLHSWICSLLIRTTPDEMRLVLIDPKRIEFGQYKDMPHLMVNPVWNPEQAISALRWTLTEVDRRFKIFTEVGVRNINVFNELPGFQKLPYIVIIIDEFSDLMAYDNKSVRYIVSQLVKMGGVLGIHIIISTSRMGMDVYPKKMRALFPSHIAFNTATVDDSNTILSVDGAEHLSGCGDMLIQLPNEDKIKRVQGATITEREIDKIVNYIKKNNPAFDPPSHTDEVNEK